MAGVTVNLRTDNAAFRTDDDELNVAEVKHTLVAALVKLDMLGSPPNGGTVRIALRDYNGNTVGDLIVSEGPGRTTGFMGDGADRYDA